MDVCGRMFLLRKSTIRDCVKTETGGETMRIVILMEDTCGNPLCEYEHGLSVYIETKKHKILMDTGAGEKTLANAGKLKVDLAQVDTVILSHGHYDHSGGLSAFVRMNRSAMIYAQKTAFGEYYHGERYIGVDKAAAGLPGIRMLDGGYEIDGELSVFTEITGRRHWPQSNIGLSEKRDGRMIQDEFRHEQCLVIRGEKTLLLSDCAHNGILNILDRYGELFGGLPDMVLSGFHMMKKTDYTEQETESIRQTAKELAEKNMIFYTGHCTGQKAIDIMQPILGNRLIPIHCGMEIEIENI